MDAHCKEILDRCLHHLSVILKTCPVDVYVQGAYSYIEGLSLDPYLPIGITMQRHILPTWRIPIPDTSMLASLDPWAELSILTQALEIKLLDAPEGSPRKFNAEETEIFLALLDQLVAERERFLAQLANAERVKRVSQRFCIVLKKKLQLQE